MSPPAVGGTMDVCGRDEDAIRADLYECEVHPLAALVRLRHEAAVHVEALLAFLDATEGDIDSFDDAEPTRDAIRAAIRLCDQPQEDDEDGADREPWLGAAEIEPSFLEFSEKYQMWFERQGDQSNWAAGSDDGRECEPEHDEDGGDDEPSLGSVEGGGDPRIGARSMGYQERWDQGSLSDFEGEHDGREPDVDDEDGGDDEEHEASGIADLDGLVEQVGYPSCNTLAGETLAEAASPDSN